MTGERRPFTDIDIPDGALDRALGNKEETGMIQGEWYTPDELRELPELAQGQADSQVGATDNQGPEGQRVWYGRTEDSPAVSVETLTERYTWETTYEGNPRRVRIGWNDKVEVEG